mmetsp:Transcript_42976/g.105993  ORF Transcript_42976/g.105993 Transcript_42976/m.105993 type:complete len:169 (+) Transcript_42976:245-751(+)
MVDTAVMSESRTCGYCYLQGPSFQLCSGCNRRAYCCRECQVNDWKRGAWHKEWCGRTGEIGVDVEIRVSSAGGSGCSLCATSRGAIRSSSSGSLKQGEIVARFPEGTPPSLERAARELTPEEGSLSSKILTDRAILGEDSSSTGIFLHMSRVNHSCVGNSTHYSRTCR